MYAVIGLTFMTMLLAVAGMAIGAMVHGRRLKGSCGGLGPNADCLCAKEGRPPECKKEPSEPPLAQLPSSRSEDARSSS